MKSSMFAVLFCCCASLGVAAEQAPFQFPRSTPEAQGMDSAAILDFVDAADHQLSVMNSFMVVRHGHVVAECWWNPYDASTRHQLYSLSKSFTSTAAGLAIAEGKFKLDDPLLSFFPDDAPAEPSENLRTMQVRHLLSMATGHQTEPSLRSSDQPWTKTFLAHDVPHQPGTHFMYNTAATYMVSAIVQKKTGQTVLDYLRPRLFDPLGIEDPVWYTSPQGVSLGGYGLNVRTEDIARLGQLYLQKGEWQGKQLLPETWVEAATSKQISNGDNPTSDWSQGYGFQFWRCRHNCYRGDGAFGQYCIVMPQQDAVVAITSGVNNMQAVLDLVWDKLLPAIHSDSLPENTESHAQLQQRVKTLAVPVQEGEATSDRAKSVSGKRYTFESNDQKIAVAGIETNEATHETTLVLQLDRAEQKAICGDKRWIKGHLTFPQYPDRAVAISGAWTDSDTYTAKICFYETPHIMTLQLRFSDGQLTLQSEMNVAFGPKKQPELVGTERKAP